MGQVDARRKPRQFERRQNKAGGDIIGEDVERPASASSGCDIAGMRAAANDIGRPHQHFDAAIVRRFGRFQRGREFGDETRSAIASRT